MKAFFPELIALVKKSALLRPLRHFIQEHFDLVEIRTKNWIEENRHEERYDEECRYQSPYPYTLGILKEFWHTHRHYVNACTELKVKYKVIDVAGPDWQDLVRGSGCDIFLVVPSVNFSSWKQMYDERVRTLCCDLKKPIFPCYGALWMWESKRRMHYWLEANEVPHPKTWVFYNRAQALSFAESAALPLVFKSNMGSGASGVAIFRDREELKRQVNRIFRKGYTNYRRGPHDKEYGSVLFQEYLENAREWRLVRIGDSYFGFEKLKSGSFHSGSHLRSYGMPPLDLLDFARDVFDRGGFDSMSLDIFVTPDGRFLVNELQTYFGIADNHEMCVVDGVAGRMLHDPKTGWRFDAGSFCQNYLYNQRVLRVLELLTERDERRKGDRPRAVAAGAAAEAISGGAP